MKIASHTDCQATANICSHIKGDAEEGHGDLEGVFKKRAGKD